MSINNRQRAITARYEVETWQYVLSFDDFHETMAYAWECLNSGDCPVVLDTYSGKKVILMKDEEE